MAMLQKLPIVVALMVGCGFNPGGEGGAQPTDAPDVVGDGPPGVIDAAEIDAPDIDAMEIDATEIDAPDIDARPMCPVGYDIVRPSGRYQMHFIGVMHVLAQADCEDDLPGRTHLATFENAATFDGDMQVVNPANSGIVFIGGVCTAIDCAVMGNWFWSTGPAIDTSMWEVNQPNNGATQKTLVAERPTGTWVINNTEATQTRAYLCECEP